MIFCASSFSQSISPFQFFEGHGWLTGEVTVCNGGRGYYQVTYVDGCREKNINQELSEIIFTPNLANGSIGSRLAVCSLGNDKY
jgi:hypothetical protein